MRKGSAERLRDLKGDEEESVLEHLPLVKWIAYRLAVRLPCNLEVQDLISAGALGLLQAMRDFDPSRKNRFQTYASIRIRGAMLDAIREQDWTPRSFRDRYKKYVHSIQQLGRRLGRPPDDEEIREDLENLKALNIQIDSVTCDGHRAILKAVRKVFKGKVVIQRCLVHIQRMSRIWLTQDPKSPAGRELLSITQQIHKIDTEEKRQYWLRALYDWDVTYADFIKEQSINPETGLMWYKHKMVRRVRRLLINAIPDMFHYLEDDQIPKSTNALESFFGHLKDNISIHRGMSYSNRKNYIKWYLHLRNKSK